MTVLVLARSERALAALDVLRPAALALAVEEDRPPPHELEAARRGLLGRSERGRGHDAELTAAFREAAQALAEQLADAARAAGFEVAEQRVFHGPRELEELLAARTFEALVIERHRHGRGRHGHHLPPHLRRLVDEATSPVVVV